MNELLREIQEDIQREQSQKLWHSFGRLMIAISIIIVLVTIGVVATQNHRESRAIERTAHLIKGLDRMKLEDYKGAIGVFDTIINEGVAPYDEIAMLRKADAQDKLGDHEGAKQTRQNLAKEGSHDNSHVFAGLSRMMEPGVAPVEPSQDSPFYHTQVEWKAWALVKEGKPREAAELFVALRDDVQAPFSMRERARAAATSLTAQAGKTDAAEVSSHE